MFFLKKLITALLMPTTAALILVGAGLGLLWYTRRERLGKWLATVGFFLLLVPSFPFVADALVGPLESRHQPLYPAERLEAALAGAPARPTPLWIVVLAGGHVPDLRVPATDQIGDSALSRLMEGIRLHREIPGSKLLLSGGIGDRIKHADVLGAVAATCGVSPENMVLHRQGRDTEEEAATIAAKVGKAPFILVTSAFHLPRATALFRGQGLSPIPAPAHHLGLDADGVTIGEVFPSPGALQNAQTGLHEYLGFVWSKIRGRM
jgi:uncharacterized SAM-binding protein YcdF (DUF218 family)